MKTASKTLTAAGAALAFALPLLGSPVLAQEAPTDTSPMSCAEFTAMDSTGKAEAVDALRVSAGSNEATGTASEGAPLTEEPQASTDGMPSSAPAAGTGADNVKTVPEATATPNVTTGNSDATTDGSASSQPTNKASSEDTPMSTAELSTEEVSALIEASCTTQPDMMVSDVMKSLP